MLELCGDERDRVAMMTELLASRCVDLQGRVGLSSSVAYNAVAFQVAGGVIARSPLTGQKIPVSMSPF